MPQSKRATWQPAAPGCQLCDTQTRFGAGLTLALCSKTLVEASLNNVIRRFGSHSGKRIYFGYDRYVLPELDAYVQIMSARAEVICAVDHGYLHYLTSAELVCTAIQADPDSIGVLVCGTGLGMSIAANKFKGVYAARCTTAEDAEQCRTINNANVLCLGAKFGLLTNKDMINAFLTAAYTGRKLEELEYITRFERDPGELAVDKLEKPSTVRRTA
jgi:ribose 5-phosphate isomerase B